MKGDNEEDLSNRPALVAAKVVRVAAYTVAGVVFGGIVAYILVAIGFLLARL